jgi:carbonic anhydrase
MLDLDRRQVLGTAATLGAAASLATVAVAPASAAATKGAGLTPDQALARLRDGNRRFVEDTSPRPDITTSRRLAIAQGQTPFAALVGCADSRVGPEYLFGTGLGDLFIVRTAGNYVDDAGFGSLAYAVAELKVPLIVVLGHEKCGAVAAANAVVNDNTQLPPSLLRMVQPILPASIDARARRQPGEDMLDRAVHLNVKRVADSLRATSDPLLAAPLAARTLRVVGAYYDLKTGAVDFFDT